MMRMSYRATWATIIALAVASVVVLVPVASLAQGCAMCATYLNGQDPRSDAFKTAIMFLMCMPFVVIGSAGGWLLWMHWRSRVPRPALPMPRADGEGAI